MSYKQTETVFLEGTIFRKPYHRDLRLESVGRHIYYDTTKSQPFYSLAFYSVLRCLSALAPKPNTLFILEFP